MRYIVTLLIVIMIAGCAPKHKIYAIDKEDMIRVPVAGARIEWNDTNDIPGDLWYTNEPGWFISDEILQKVYDAEAQEDLTPNIWDRIWKGLGL